ncbi:hypothetical protein ABTZ58_23855 [Streptomyces sp. NPDC094143]|uniref:hypothetical protein n=1 Tax=Streptomyces sp. NPDC094143 TaxID=3155310 RepID=UPI0033185C07
MLAVLAAAALFAVLRPPAAGPEGDRVGVGRVCRSALAPGLELSCGSAGFGDLRYVCHPRADGGRCARTKAVTVRNDGRSTTYVSIISGPRQGVREQGTDVRVVPGDTATLRPGEDGYLFDITVRAVEEVPAVLRVTRVR